MACSRSRYDDDEDDFRPRRRRRDDDAHDPHRGGGGLPVGLIVGGAVGAVLLVVGGIVLAVTVRKPAAPDPAPDPAAAEVADPLLGVNPRPGPVAGPKRGKEVVIGPAPAPKKPGVGIALPAEGPGAAYYAFAGGEDGVVAYLGMAPVGGDILTVARTKTGERVGRTQLKIGDDGAVFAVAPGGRYAGILSFSPDGDAAVVVDVPAGNSYRFTPYSKKANITNPGLIGFGFPAADRLLTVNQTSGFDVWEIPSMKRVCGHPGRPPSSIPFVANDGFSKCPVNYGLSADGKTFAVFDGAGFAFHDTATAALKAKTEPLLAPGMLSMNSWGCAFNAAGTRFAFMGTLHAPKQATGLLVWEPATGMRVSFTPVDHGKRGAGFAWWGPDHLAVWQGGRSEVEVMDVKTGQIVADVKLLTTGLQQSIATSTPGDKLWYTYNANRYDARMPAPCLVSVPAPAALPGRNLALTPDGPQWR
ncbi:hypothetical protein J0H58_04535 [bacterium]|nr:hypothetical protein [bacterium]